MDRSLFSTTTSNVKQIVSGDDGSDDRLGVDGQSAAEGLDSHG